MNEDLPTTEAAGEAPAELVKSGTPATEAPPEDIVDPSLPAGNVGSGEASFTVIPPHTAAAATGVLSRLESDFEKEFAKGTTAFMNWFKSTVAELKLHLKV